MITQFGKFFVCILFISFLFAPVNVFLAQGEDKGVANIATLKNLIESRKYDEAIKFIKNYEPTENKFEFYKVSADFLMKIDMFVKAIDYWRLAYVNAESQKDKDLTILKRAECYIKLRNYDEAKLSLVNLIKNSPKSLYLNDAYLMLGSVYEALGQVENAILYYQKVPPTISAQLLKAKSYVKLGKYNEAVKIFENIVNSEKEVLQEYPDAYYYYGEALRNIDMLRKSKTYLSGAKRIHGYAEKANLSLGLIAYKEKDIDAAVNYFKVVVNGDNRDAKSLALFNLGKIYLEKGLKKEAKEYFTKLRNNFPVSKEYSMATYYLIDFSIEEGDYEKACNLINELLKSSVDDTLIDEIVKVLTQLAKHNNKEFNNKFERYSVYLFKARRYDVIISLSEKADEEKRVRLLANVFLASTGKEKKDAANMLFNYHIRKGEYEKAQKYEKFIDSKVTEKLKIYDYVLDGNYNKALKFLENNPDSVNENIEIVFYLDSKIKDKVLLKKIITKLIGKNQLTVNTLISIGDYYSEKDRTIALSAYTKALESQNLKNKSDLEIKIKNIKQDVKANLDEKKNISGDSYKKVLEKEQHIDKILREYKL